MAPWQYWFDISYVNWWHLGFLIIFWLIISLFENNQNPRYFGYYFYTRRKQKVSHSPNDYHYFVISRGRSLKSIFTTRSKRQTRHVIVFRNFIAYIVWRRCNDLTNRQYNDLSWIFVQWRKAQLIFLIMYRRQQASSFIFVNVIYCPWLELATSVRLAVKYPGNTSDDSTQICVMLTRNWKVYL